MMRLSMTFLPVQQWLRMLNFVERFKMYQNSKKQRPMPNIDFSFKNIYKDTLFLNLTNKQNEMSEARVISDQNN